eukprot:TRINITY_DN5588_c1_g2_i2.p1 TRINITY_DN5588_c1_g2~~TRINITY_DN5588_c1_g2_i2.p1  ORF type:complete len:683 (-),score=125.03 TRINITY_DN5588_c1_g2_i2:1095-3143(-)
MQYKLFVLCSEVQSYQRGAFDERPKKSQKLKLVKEVSMQQQNVALYHSFEQEIGTKVAVLKLLETAVENGATLLQGQVSLQRSALQVKLNQYFVRTFQQEAKNGEDRQQVWKQLVSGLFGLMVCEIKKEARHRQPYVSALIVQLKRAEMDYGRDLGKICTGYLDSVESYLHPRSTSIFPPMTLEDQGEENAQDQNVDMEMDLPNSDEQHFGDKQNQDFLPDYLQHAANTQQTAGPSRKRSRTETDQADFNQQQVIQESSQEDQQRSLEANLDTQGNYSQNNPFGQQPILQSLNQMDDVPSVVAIHQHSIGEEYIIPATQEQITQDFDEQNLDEEMLVDNVENCEQGKEEQIATGSDNLQEFENQHEQQQRSNMNSKNQQQIAQAVDINGQEYQQEQQKQKLQQGQFFSLSQIKNIPWSAGNKEQGLQQNTQSTGEQDLQSDLNHYNQITEGITMLTPSFVPISDEEDDEYNDVKDEDGSDDDELPEIDTGMDENDDDEEVQEEKQLLQQVQQNYDKDSEITPSQQGQQLEQILLQLKEAQPEIQNKQQKQDQDFDFHQTQQSQENDNEQEKVKSQQKTLTQTLELEFQPSQIIQPQEKETQQQADSLKQNISLQRSQSEQLYEECELQEQYVLLQTQQDGSKQQQPSSLSQPLLEDNNVEETQSEQNQQLQQQGLEFNQTQQ